MNPDTVTFDVTYTESRSRLTSAFRYILALPHLLFAGLWGYAANILAFLQWFVILFTGRRNQGMWDFQRAYLGYEVRVSSYASLLYDEYPNFGSTWRDEPVAFGFDFRPDANRLTSALRLIWIIPALFISFFLGIAVFFILFVSWVVIIVTGRHPRGMWDFIRACVPLQLRAVGLRDVDDGRVSALRRFGADEHAPARRPPRVIRQHPAEHRDAAPAAVGSAGWLTARQAMTVVTSTSGRDDDHGRDGDSRPERGRRCQRHTDRADDLRGSRFWVAARCGVGLHERAGGR